MGHFAQLCKGLLADGTYDVDPVFAWGDASFSSSMPGCKSAPTTALRKAAETVCKQANVWLVDEFRSTMCCSCCGSALYSVYAPPTRRQIEAHAARAERQLPHGWTRPPQRPLPSMVKVRGLLYCANPLCGEPRWRLKGRDADACRLILARFRAETAGEQPPACLSREVFVNKAVGRVYFF